MLNKWLFALVALAMSFTAYAQSTNEYATEKYFDAIRSNPQQLQRFLQTMPKGADLHNHSGGASMAENLIRYAKGDHFCIDRKTWSAVTNPNCAPDEQLDNVKDHPDLYDALVDAWSMRHFHTGLVTGHDHFFATFDKYRAVASKHDTEMLGEIIDRAGAEKELYMEIMMTLDHNASGLLGKQLGWDANWSRMRDKLLNGGLNDIISAMSKNLDDQQAHVNKRLLCDSHQATPGCQVKVRYLYQVLREQVPEAVFAQLLAGFEIANRDPRVVGINMVQPEDGKLSMRDYTLQMQMVGFLHRLYPRVRISLHAGELSPALVQPEGLRFHIREAVQTAEAERIGHGVALRYEESMQSLLNEMATKHVLVEINLSSNDMILGVKGQDHPFLLYMHNAVPVALSTDDEGILRTNLSKEYERAILTYQLSYATVKTLARNSIAYSFLPGQALWSDYQYSQIVPSCAKDVIGATTPSPTCQALLNTSEKAQMQWKLERQFTDFENGFAH